MAIKTDGSLWGWGDNQYGALGDGTTSNRNVPTLIGSDTWAAVSCGGDYGSTMALRSDGSLWGWGFNGYGTIGDGTNVNKSAPTRVGGDTDWAAVSQGTTVTTGLKTGGALWNWGYSPYGELGDGTVDDEHFYLPSPLATATWLGGGSSSHTMAIKADDSLWAWGRNNFGQIGDGTNINRNAPVSISLTATSADLGNAASPMEGAKTLKAMDLPTKLHKQERWPGKPRRRQ
jgi:alpha-tubulin suppressor-like RCC1 family protein